MKKYLLYLVLFLCLSCKKEDTARIRNPQQEIPFDSATEALPVNKLQYVCSHNSYRLKTDPAIYKLVNAIRGFLPSNLDPHGWDYTHLPIPDQFDLGVRGLELDIYNDPAGGRYFNRLGNKLVGKPVPSYVDELKQPGMKIIHIPDFDYNTNYFTFKSALTAIKTWSSAHPQHLPLFILVELKTTSVGSVIPGFTKPLPFSAAAMDSVDQEVIDIFGAGNPQLFKPDDLRGSYSTLKEAVLNKGWPTVAAMRGKVILIVYENDNYLTGHPNLEGRQMFQFTDEHSPNAAFIRIDEAGDDFAHVQSLVNAGYIVRSRTDEETHQARNGDYTQRDEAFTSGAQILSTDYYRPDARAGKPGWTDFHVNFDDISFARVNILNAPDDLKGKYVRE